MSTDPRFSKVHSDPRFIRLKKDAAKLKIDSRFASMLNSEEFGAGSSGPKVDKYGRKTVRNVKKDLERFYKLEPEESENDQKEVTQGVSRVEDLPGYHLARGEGLLESSDEELCLYEGSDAEDEDSGPFGEEDIPTGEETKRLAVVNLDWDYVKSKDLFKLFDGFKPTHGMVKSVRVYPSEFGKERMRQEEVSGPPAEIFNASADKGPLIKEDDGKEFDNVQLRKYQLERLRYYYAIVECDSVKTAKHIYEACDGAEFEASANFLDLRYVPDDTTFDDEPRDEATEAPLTYQPTDFVTRALQHSNVKLTWDEDDPERIKTTHRKFTKEDIKEMDFKTYLASDSEDEEDPDFIREKYQALLGGNAEEDAEKEDMEITFISGLSEKAAKLVEKKKKEDARKGETVFEAQLRERREKKKERRKERSEGGQKASQDLLVNEDEERRDEEDDPFFQLDDSEFEAPAPTVAKPKKKSKQKEPKEDDSKSRAELELLLMDDQESQSRHFDVKSVLKSEKQLKKKKKRKSPKIMGDTQDDFELDTQDPRFTDILESHHFAIDPTNPQFKKTKNMDKLLQMRRSHQKEDIVHEKPTPPSQKRMISSLVASIKQKSVPFHGKRQKMTKIAE